MVAAVEMRRGEDSGNVVPGAVVDEDTAQNRLLGLDRMRRDPERQSAGSRRCVIEQWIDHLGKVPGRRLDLTRGEGGQRQNSPREARKRFDSTGSAGPERVVPGQTRRAYRPAGSGSTFSLMEASTSALT